jgi:hypothetical protein
MSSQFSECLGQIINDEPVMICKELHPHFGYFPTRDVIVNTVKKGHIIADDVGHRHKKMRRLNHHFYRLIGIAEHRY